VERLLCFKEASKGDLTRLNAEVSLQEFLEAPED
jgi:hypothetical protein